MPNTSGPVDSHESEIDSVEELRKEPDESVKHPKEAPTEPERFIAIPNSYAAIWPIPEEERPPYKWVLLVNKPKSVREFADEVGHAIPEVLKKLRKRGLAYLPNSLISLPILRSLAFEFECYPAYLQEEYDSISAEADFEEDVEQDAEEDIHVSKSVELGERKDPPKKWRDVPRRELLIQEVNLTAPVFTSKTTRSKLNPLGLFAEDKPAKVGSQQSLSKSPLTSHAENFENESNFTSISHAISKVKPMENSDELQKIVISPPVLIPDLAARLGLKPFNIMADLIKLGVFPAPNQPLDAEIAAKICKIHGLILEREQGL